MDIRQEIFIKLVTGYIRNGKSKTEAIKLAHDEIVETRNKLGE